MRAGVNRPAVALGEARITSAVRGNARARAAVLRALQDRWFAYALAQLLSVSAARDAVQEAGLRVLGRLGEYDAAQGPIADWSLGAVVLAVREVRALDGGAPPLLAAARRAGLKGEPPAFSRQATDAADALAAALDALAPAEREAAVLRLVDRRPTAVVAGLLNVEPAALKSAAAAIGRGDGTVWDRLGRCREWLALARYPGDLRRELFRVRTPSWLVPAAVGSLAASVLLIGVAHHYRPARPATQPNGSRPSKSPSPQPSPGVPGGGDAAQVWTSPKFIPVTVAATPTLIV